LWIFFQQAKALGFYPVWQPYESAHAAIEGEGGGGGGGGGGEQ
jgi:hypothetical protein